MKKIIFTGIVLLITSAGCISNYIKANRMFDSAMRFDDSAKKYYHLAISHVYKDTKLSDYYAKKAETFDGIHNQYGDSMNFYFDHKFDFKLAK